MIHVLSSGLLTTVHAYTGDQRILDLEERQSFRNRSVIGGMGAMSARWAEDGSSKRHPLDDPRHQGASILISNANFGCGSSREHAPQALAKSGFRAVIAESFAEIFFGNATTLGMPCVAVTRDKIQDLAALTEKTPDVQLVIDLPAQTISAGSLTVPFTIKPGARDALGARARSGARGGFLLERHPVRAAAGG